MNKNLLYISDSNDAFVNLGTDEWFLDHVGGDEMILHLYVNENAVIIGKNQDPRKECDLGAMKADKVQLVRRVSGGGAVYHDVGNLNFSFIAGLARYDRQAQHNLILDAIRSLGIDCDFTGRNDLLCGGKKFSGNAYCSRVSAAQHHGTLLVSSDLSKLQRYLTVDPRKIASKGVDSVRARVCDLSDIIPSLTVGRVREAVIAAFERAYGCAAAFSFAADEYAGVEKYILKHASDEWRLGNTPPFDVQIDCRLSFGGVQVYIKTGGLRIVSSRTYTDANDDKLAAKIDGCITGLQYDRETVLSALAESGDTRLAELGEYIAQSDTLF